MPNVLAINHGNCFICMHQPQITAVYRFTMILWPWIRFICTPSKFFQFTYLPTKLTFVVFFVVSGGGEFSIPSSHASRLCPRWTSCCSCHRLWARCALLFSKSLFIFSALSILLYGTNAIEQDPHNLAYLCKASPQTLQQQTSQTIIPDRYSFGSLVK